MVQSSIAKRHTNKDQRVLYFLGVSPDLEKELMENIFGKKPNPVEELIRERRNEEDAEAIYEAGMCWDYECGALVKAMELLGYSPEQISQVINVMSFVQDTVKASYLSKAYERFQEDND